MLSSLGWVSQSQCGSLSRSVLTAELYTDREETLFLLCVGLYTITHSLFMAQPHISCMATLKPESDMNWVTGPCFGVSLGTSSVWTLQLLTHAKFCWDPPAFVRGCVELHLFVTYSVDHANVVSVWSLTHCFSFKLLNFLKVWLYYGCDLKLQTLGFNLEVWTEL